MKELFLGRNASGEYSSLLREITESNEDHFKQYMRMNRDTFKSLLK